MPLLTVKVRLLGGEEAPPSLFVRVLSEWMTCATSGPFGSDTLQWTSLSEESVGDTCPMTKYAVYTTTCDAFSSDYNETLVKFNKNPMITVLLMQKQSIKLPDADVESDEIVPVSFAITDCSMLALDTRELVTRSQTQNGVVLEVTVTNDNSFIERTNHSTFEPLVIDIQKIGGFPVLPAETLRDAYDTCYIYGCLQFGQYSRNVFARPKVDYTIIDSTQDSKFEDDFVTVGLELCMLPSLIGLEYFKESLTSTAFTVQLHREDINVRAFHERNKIEYVLLSKTVTEPVAEVVVPVKGAKAAPPPVKAAGDESILTEKDKFLLSCISKALTTSGQIYSHGTATFRLERLLESSVDLLTKFSILRNGNQDNDENVVVKEDMLIEVRLAKPSRPEKASRPSDMSMRTALSNLRITDESKLDGTLQFAQTTPSGIVRAESNPSLSKTMPLAQKPRYEQFFECETRVIMTAELRRRLAAPPQTYVATVGCTVDESMARILSITPFTRMIFVMRYDDDETLEAINKVVTNINLRALPDIQGTLRSYSFTDDELMACNKGTLDVITGFTVIDDEMRIIAVEGLAGPGLGMQDVFTDMPRQSENNAKLKILFNPEVLFPHRLYGSFGPDFKRIRVRDKLKVLARRPELYNRKQVDVICFNAIDNIMSLRRALDLHSTKEFNMYPSADSLNKVELLYGEAISRADLDGVAAAGAMQSKLKKIPTTSTTLGNAGTEAALTINGAPSDSIAKKGKTNKTAEINPKTLPTDCRNSVFEEYLLTRDANIKDYLEEQRELKRKAWESMLQRTVLRDQACNESLNKILGAEGAQKGKIYIYSQQALNFRVLNFTDLRQQLANKTDATYTFSQDFVSQTVCVVDEDVDRKKIAAEKRSHWLTSKGFQYPKPKTLKDLITHPKRPSDIRVEELREPWMGDAAPSNRDATVSADTLRLEQGYSVRIRGGDLFGTLEPMEFERPFNLRLVGDRAKLPRGKVTAGEKQDPAAMRSIHLGGEGQAKIIEDALEKEKEEWKKKVVVDSLSIKIGGFKERDKVLQFQRTKDILDGEPNRLALKHLRTKKSATGRDLRYETAPLSIMQSGPFVQNAAQKALMRGVDRTKFITAKEVISPDQTPTDFYRFINSDANTKKILTVLSKKAITQLKEHEKTGPKWHEKL